jgi:polar amino acid transport system permease protein
MYFFVAALLALSWNEGAYMAEIVRAGIDSIDPGQLEAARSLGMTYFVAMRRIVLPQAARTIVPPLGNEFNGMLKNTSLASVIGLTELLQTSINIGNALFLQLELFVVASFWYLMMTTVWTAIQAYIERKLNVSVTDFGPGQGSWTQRLLGFGRRGPVAVAGAGGINVPADRGAR